MGFKPDIGRHSTGCLMKAEDLCGNIEPSETNSNITLQEENMKKILVLLIALSLVTLASMSVIANDKGPAEITLEASMGTVNFNHAAHQERNSDCTTCHHQGEFTNCHTCHDGTAAPKAKKVFHASCKGCHVELKSGPTKCKECHIK